MAAASARRRASRRCPAERSVSPARKSRPLGRTKRPGAAASRMVTASPSRRASSWMTIASAPSGIGAPVKMRTASPAADDAREAAPGERSRRRRATSPAGSPRPPRARRSRPWRKRRRAAACAARRGRRRACARGRQPSGTSSAARGSRTLASTRRERFLDGKQAHASVGLVVARVAAALGDEADAFDAHGPVDRLDHVVDRQAGDRDGGERLHLDAGLARHLHLRRHAHAGQGVVEGAIDADWSTGAADGRAGSARACAWPP